MGCLARAIPKRPGTEADPKGQIPEWEDVYTTKNSRTRAETDKGLGLAGTGRRNRQDGQEIKAAAIDERIARTSRGTKEQESRRTREG